MSVKMCSKENCSNTLTTNKGTYTFHNENILKSEAAKLCKKNGGIIAPLNTQEEFDAVHKFAYECQPWCSYHFYHVGLDLTKNETRFYSDCTEWDWEKHDKLYDSHIKKGHCYEALYMPFYKIQKIYTNAYCGDFAQRTICFNAVDKNLNKTEALVQTKYADSVNSFTVSNTTFAFTLLTIGLLLALVRSTNKIRMYEKKLSALNFV